MSASHDPQRAAMAAFYAPVSQRSIAPENLRAVIADIRASGKPDANLMADYLEVLASTGIRPTQVEQMTLEHMSCSAGTVLVPHEKSGRTKALPVDADSARLIGRIAHAAYIRRVGIASRVFPEGTRKAANAAIEDACTRLGIPKFTCLTLRHFHSEHSGLIQR